MLIEIRWLFTNLMLVVLRIVASIISPEPFPQNSVDVFGFPNLFVLTHHEYIWFYEVALKACGLSEKSFYSMSMILRKHRRYWIPLCGELE